MLSVLIGVLIICVVGAICFWAIEKFVNDERDTPPADCARAKRAVTRIGKK